MMTSNLTHSPHLQDQTLLPAQMPSLQRQPRLEPLPAPVSAPVPTPAPVWRLCLQVSTPCSSKGSGEQGERLGTLRLDKTDDADNYSVMDGELFA